MEIDLSEIYKESGLMTRHYSSASLSIRLALLAQGIILITASGVLYRENDFIEASVVSVFGLLFTIVLWVLDLNYQRKITPFLYALISLEKRMTNEEEKIYTLFEEDYQITCQTYLGEFLIIRGIFTFMVITFLAMLVTAASKL